MSHAGMLPEVLSAVTTEIGSIGSFTPTMLQANSSPESVIWTRSPNFNDGYSTRKDPSYHTGLGTSVEGIIGYQDSSTKKWNYQTTVAPVSTSRYVHPAFTVPDTVFIGPNKEIRFEESVNEV